MDKSKQKQQLREVLLKRRNGISEEAYLHKSEKICEHLQNIAVFKQANVVHCYVSMNERNEVNTHPLIKQMLAGDKQVVVPVTKMEEGTLHHTRLNRFNELKPNKWGVLEPQGGFEVSPEVLDLVIVPMAGADAHKNRIGYGGGFYDRFLAHTNCPKVGLLFEKCLVESLPTESFDIPLDKLIMEKGMSQ